MSEQFFFLSTSNAVIEFYQFSDFFFEGMCGFNEQSEQGGFLGRGDDRCYHLYCENMDTRTKVWGTRGNGGYNSATEVCTDSSVISPLGAMLGLDYPRAGLRYNTIL